MKAKAEQKVGAKPHRKPRKNLRAVIAEFTAEFGPKPGEIAGQGEAVEFLIRQRHGDA